MSALPHDWDPNQYRLLLPSRLDAVPAALAFVRALAEDAGFPEAERFQIELATEEAASNAVKHAYRPHEHACIEITCRTTALGLEIRVRDEGRPFDPDAVERHDPAKMAGDAAGRGLGVFLIEHMMDRAQFRNLGAAGKEVRLVKFRPAVAIERPVPPPEASAPATPAGTAPVELSIHPMQPDEAIKVAQCVYEAYGYSYVYEHVYFPDRMVRLNESGEICSLVATTRDGAVAGHAALVFGEDPNLCDLAICVTLPEFRGRQVARRLAEELIGYARKRGSKAVFIEQVTSHPFTQRFASRLGMRDCALLLGLAPATLSFRGIAETLGQRESILLGLLPVAERPDVPVIHPPEHHAEMVERLYASVGCPFGRGAPDAPILPPAREQTTLGVAISGNLAVATLTVQTYGADVKQRVLHETNQAHRAKAEVVVLHLPLEQPETAWAVPVLEEAGFLFTGILPRTSGGDTLILQHLLGTVLDYDAICVESPVAQDLLAYVRARDPASV